jgi:hypothetical protein
MMRLLDKCASNGNSVEIVWRYEEDDESILMLGEDLDALTDIPFKMEKIEMSRQKLQKIKVKSKKTSNEAIITLKYWDAIVRNGHGDDYIIIEENL